MCDEKAGDTEAAEMTRKQLKKITMTILCDRKVKATMHEVLDWRDEISRREINVLLQKTEIQ